MIFFKTKKNPLGKIHANAGADRLGLRATEKIPFGSLVVMEGDEHCRLIKTADTEFTGIAIIPTCRGTNCLPEEYREAYMEGEIVDITRMRDEVSVKLKEKPVINKPVYYNAGELSLTKSDNYFGKVVDVLDEDEKICTIFIGGLV